MKYISGGMLALTLIFSLTLTGCPTDGGKTDDWPLEKYLGKYMASEKQTRDNNTVDVSVYFLDPDRFEAFKAELDAGDEYNFANDSWTRTRDWDKDVAFVRWTVWPNTNGKCELELCKADNSLTGYKYQAASSGDKPKTEALLRKYIGPKAEKWDEDGGKITYVYHLDPTRAKFEALKAELDAGGAYLEVDSWARTDTGRTDPKTRLRWCIRPSGRIFQLDFWDGATKYDAGYRYVKKS